ncbi:hypothetical protein BDP81DRAFT_74681 [Colletotrichum phormii]|uniref:Uncharacterized protein n=1 Tax=Colletotrichum phormii TaxID=359342 RepID=A0AAJ0EBX8_9PEZI|nr:uncharacterized protein BDP81DRAFT_74681 [Colletotrichum phormii]KAK1625590.1 hypothetical protein BDP81DRAFT_74681 [Colletotrichum phormii]
MVTLNSRPFFNFLISHWLGERAEITFFLGCNLARCLSHGVYFSWCALNDEDDFPSPVLSSDYLDPACPPFRSGFDRGGSSSRWRVGPLGVMECQIVTAEIPMTVVSTVPPFLLLPSLSHSELHKKGRTRENDFLWGGGEGDEREKMTTRREYVFLLRDEGQATHVTV